MITLTHRAQQQLIVLSALDRGERDLIDATIAGAARGLWFGALFR